MQERKKNHSKIFLTLTIILTAGIIFFFPGGADEVRASTKVLYQSGDGTSGTKKVDLTGDGKKETIKFHISKSDDEIDRFVIKINGKKVFTAKDARYDVAVDYVKLSSKVQFLWIRNYGDNDDSDFEALYQYQKSGRKLKKILDFDSVNWKEGVCHIYTNEVKTTKSTVTVSYWGQMNATGYIGWDCVYNYKDGKLTLKSSASAVKKAIQKNKVFTANQPLTFYKSTKMKSPAFSVKSGEKVTLKKIKVYKGAYYLQFQKGKKKGWISANQSDIFAGVELAG